MISDRILDLVKRYDPSFLLINTAIFIMGIMNLYSATHLSTSDRLSSLFKIQLGYFLIAFGIGIFVSFIRPKTIFRFSYAVNKIMNAQKERVKSKKTSAKIILGQKDEKNTENNSLKLKKFWTSKQKY